ncbi:MAG: transcriptional attenuator, LytR family [Actinomycetia bacterium]|nr:transcriptional attenuator, LytR family [Actinomycetes bacterium]
MRAFASRFVIALVVVALLMGGAVAVANNKVTAALGSIKKVKVKVAAIPAGQPANFLLIGSDTRAFVTDASQASSFGDPKTQAGQRADSIMIMHVDADAKKIILMSIPRDTWVHIDGIGMSKINAALNGANGVSGPDLLIRTITQTFGIPINHFLAVNFDTFGKVVDAIGTVPIYFQYPVRDHNTSTGVNETGLDQHAGCQRLDGAHALQYVRSRYYQQYINGRWVSDPTSDIGRATRQQEFLRVLASQAVKKGLNNPLTASNITSSLLPNLTADQALTTDVLLRLINAYKNVNPDDRNAVRTETLPTTIGTAGTQSILRVPNTLEVAFMLGELKTFSPKTTTTTTTTKAAANAPKPSTIRVKVLNRNGGVVGGAAATLASLTKDGFVGAGTGDSGRAVAKTEVRYGTGSEAKAKVVQSYLAGGATLVADPSITGNDVTVVIGADFTSVVAPASATTTTTAAASIPIIPPTTTTKSAAELACK